MTSILRGETSAREAGREHELKVGEIEQWQERFLLGAQNALLSRPRDEEAFEDEEIKRLKQKIGDLVLDLDISRPRSSSGRSAKAVLFFRGRPQSD